jgi:hypothetical protein
MHAFYRRPMPLASVSRQPPGSEAREPGPGRVQGGATDRRVRESAVTAKGKLMTERLDAARERLARTVFSSWIDDNVEELVRLTSKLADAMNEAPANAAARPTRKLDRK